jgi:nickel-dependent lactate racemase
MSDHHVARREVLRSALVPLIGTALSQGPFQPASVAALKGSARSVVIPTHEWAGELDERLDFPADWQVEVLQMKGADAPELGASQIAEALGRPIGAAPLREIAAGRKRVAITFDDLTRPTPTYAVTPWVMSELKAAGIKDEDILLIAAYGSHRAMTLAEVQQKLGKRVANGYAWLNHNVFENVKEIGETSFKNRIFLNQSFLAADLKICLSGVKAHEQAGVSGGAKAILPGLASLDTIEFNHQVVLPRTKTAGTFKVFKNEMRQDMIEAARMAKVDFSVQIVINQKRRPVFVSSGDIVTAHQAAARVAARHYITPFQKDADIVVSNAYPVNCQAFRARWWIDRTLREGGTGVLIVQHPLGLDPIHWLSSRVSGRNGATWFDMVKSRPEKLPRATGLIVYSQYLSRSMMNSYPRDTRFAATWDVVIRLLREKHKGAARVSVYPYGGIQEEELPLDA